MAMDWASQPWLTYALIVVNSVVFVWTSLSEVNVAEYAFQYDAIIQKHEYWRAFTSQFLHADILHIGFNMLTLFTLKYIEEHIGMVNYAVITATLLLLSPLFMISLYKLADACYPSGDFRHTFSIGYSCVLFGLFVVSASLFPNAEYNMFGQRVPAFLMPLVSLLITQLLVPGASLIGHAGGLVAGLCVGAMVKFGVVSRGQSYLLFHNSVLLILSMTAWLLLILVLQLKRRSEIQAATTEPSVAVAREERPYQGGEWYGVSGRGAAAAGSSGGRGRYEGGSGAVGYGEIGTGFSGYGNIPGTNVSHYGPNAISSGNVNSGFRPLTYPPSATAPSAPTLPREEYGGRGWRLGSGAGV